MYDPAAMPMPKLPANAREVRAAQPERRRRQFVDDERMIRVMRAKYFGAITHIDDQVGRLLGELRRLGMADNTLVLFTADHGNMLGDHGRWFKGVQYEGSARVPLLWRGPKGSRENGGRVVDKVVENTDLMPSILETAGLPLPEGVQGRSFLKLARQGDPTWKNRCFSQLRSGSLLEGGFKYIDNSLDGTGSRELYDLANDPVEHRNLSDDPRHRERVSEMARSMAAWRADRPAPARVQGMSAPDYSLISKAERDEAAANAPDALEAAGAERKGGSKKR
jgi:arylsulfatase A-like enzyme